MRKAEKMGKNVFRGPIGVVEHQGCRELLVAVLGDSVWLGNAWDKESGKRKWITGETSDFSHEYFPGHLKRQDLPFLRIHLKNVWACGDDTHAYPCIIEWDD